MPKTVLLADDSVTIQKVVGISLANEDIELVTVENGDDAITRAREVRPDIVLADIVMPGKNGYEVCEAVKRDPSLAGIPVLLLTGTFEPFDAERARQAGADGHITKPFEAQALVDHVNQLLARARPLAEESVPPAPASGGDSFSFDDAGEADNETSWPTHAAPTPSAMAFDDSGTDLMGDSTPPSPGPDSDETVLLDTRRGSADPAFDAAVDAAAFDAPGERTRLEDNEDSGFDLETADLSMSGSVPPVSAEPAAMTFSDPTYPGSQRAAEARPPAAAPEAARAVGPDPLADFGPSDPDRTVLDDSLVQSFDVAPEEVVEPTGEVSEETSPIIEDADPARFQSSPAREPEEIASDAGGAGAIPHALQQQLHATLEKMAWEAFGGVSEQVVQEALARIEAIAWEVIPQMAETLIREEIARMQEAGEE